MPDYAEFDLQRLPRTPAFVVDLAAIERNGRRLAEVHERTGATVLLALKAFGMAAAFPRLRPFLSGTTASGLHEAWHGQEHFGGQVHVYNPAYKATEMAHLVRFAHTLVFNSPGQWRRYRPVVEASGREIEIGLRINHGHGEVETELYNPCAPGSRLGYPAEALTEADLDGLTGLHFHSLCEQDADVLERTLEVFEAKCGAWLPRLQWVNFGGGHHITRPGYQFERLCGLINRFRQRYGLQVYLEPGEAAAIRTGVLVGEVLDSFTTGGMEQAIVDVSATAHMPDTLEMPYRADIRGAGLPGEHPHTYRLGGPTCLAGDVIGDYSFAQPLAVGQRLAFDDTSHYTMVKTTTFNGVPHPDLYTFDPASNTLSCVRKFHYGDFSARLG